MSKQHCETMATCAYLGLLCPILGFLLAIAHFSQAECQGTCMDEGDVKEKCFSDGGVITTPCSQTQFCCEKSDEAKASIGKCSQFKNKTSTPVFFQSPFFPYLIVGTEIVCQFVLELNDDTVGIMLDFQNFISDGVKIGSRSIECDQDMFFIKGFQEWAPSPLCGDLSGYKIVIDRNKLENMNRLTLVAVMSGPMHMWSIKITQITAEECPALTEVAAPEENSEATDAPAADAPAADARSGKNLGLGVQSSKMNYRMKRSMDSIIPLVVNGLNTVPGQVPWQASLRLNAAGLAKQNLKIMIEEQKCDISEGVHRCGGTIISDREILTAGHCVHGQAKMQTMLPIQSMLVYVGDINSCQDEPGFANTQVLGVESVTLHYNYDQGLGMNDVAILRLNSSIQFNDNVKPIEMAKSGEKFDGSEASVSGWGPKSVEGPHAMGYTTILQHSDNMIVTPSASCAQSLSKILGYPKMIVHKLKKYQDFFKDVICTESKNKSLDVLVSPGDSGGPLVSKTASGDPVLIGIISYALPFHHRHITKSAGDFIDFYQSVAYFRDWIDTTQCFLQTSGPSKWLRGHKFVDNTADDGPIEIAQE